MQIEATAIRRLYCSLLINATDWTITQIGPRQSFEGNNISKTDQSLLRDQALSRNSLVYGGSLLHPAGSIDPTRAMALQRSCLFSLAMHMPQRTLRPLSTVRTSFRHGSGYRYTSQQRIRTRSLHTTPSNAYARKGSQDKDSIDRESTEYSKSGTDDGTAEQDQAAFDPSITDPTGEKKKAGQGKGVSDENPFKKIFPRSLSIASIVPGVLVTKSRTTIGTSVSSENASRLPSIERPPKTSISHERKKLKLTRFYKSPQGEANPLEVSPANPEVSKPRGDTEGGAEHAAGEDRSRTSGGGSGQKAGRR